MCGYNHWWCFRAPSASNDKRRVVCIHMGGGQPGAILGVYNRAGHEHVCVCMYVCMCLCVCMNYVCLCVSMYKSDAFFGEGIHG